MNELLGRSDTSRITYGPIDHSGWRCKSKELYFSPLMFPLLIKDEHWGFCMATSQRCSTNPPPLQIPHRVYFILHWGYLVFCSPVVTLKLDINFPSIQSFKSFQQIICCKGGWELMICDSHGFDVKEKQVETHSGIC